MSQCSRLLYFRIILLLCLLTLGSCKSETHKTNWTPGTLLTTTIDEVHIEVELAIHRQEQQKGLMFRETLPEHQGMLFIFKNSSSRSFWMKNTLLPLDIAYINSKGIIQEIYPMYPRNLNSVKSHSKEIQFVLEMNQGWFLSNSIKPGATLDLQFIRSIMEANNVPIAD